MPDTKSLNEDYKVTQEELAPANHGIFLKTLMDPICYIPIHTHHFVLFGVGGGVVWQGLYYQS